MLAFCQVDGALCAAFPGGCPHLADRHLDLRHQGHAPCVGIGHEVHQLVPFVAIRPDLGVGRGGKGEDLVVREMEVQVADLVEAAHLHHGTQGGDGVALPSLATYSPWTLCHRNSLWLNLGGGMEYNSFPRKGSPVEKRIERNRNKASFGSTSSRVEKQEGSLTRSTGLKLRTRPHLCWSWNAGRET